MVERSVRAGITRANERPGHGSKEGDAAEMNREVHLNKGTVECPKPQARHVAREFVSEAIDHNTLFSGTLGLPIAANWQEIHQLPL